MGKKHVALKEMSGAKGRAFRKLWAAGGEIVKPTVRTIQFPLEANEHTIDMEAVTALHKTLRGQGEGSLLGLLYCVHANGFRLFSKSDEVAAFNNEQVLDNTAYKSALADKLGVAIEKLDPVNLFVRFSFAPRNVGTKVVEWTKPFIASEFCLYFSGKRPEKADPVFVSLMEDLATRLLPLGEWKNLVADPVAGFKAWDATVSAKGYGLPPLAPKAELIVPLVNPIHNSTIAFDASREPLALAAGAELHCLASLLLQQARSEGIVGKRPLTDRLQQLLLSDNFSGLSWLFGAGLRVFQAKSPQELASLYGANGRVEAFGQVAKYACAIQPDRVFGSVGFAEYRMDIGGGIKSWLANYVNRLDELDQLLLAPPDAWTLPADMRDGQTSYLLTSSNITPTEIDALIGACVTDYAAARKCLDRLYGAADEPATAEDVRFVELFGQSLDALHGMLTAIADRRERETLWAADRNDDQLVTLLNAVKFDIPKWCARLPKLNRLAVPESPTAAVERAGNQFVALRDAIPAQFERLKQWAEGQGTPLKPIERATARERQDTLNVKGKRPKGDAGGFGQRAAARFLDRFCRTVSRCKEPTVRRFADLLGKLDVFESEKAMNRFLFNRVGGLYKSPFDPGVRIVHKVKPLLADRFDAIMSRLWDEIQVVRREVFADEVLKADALVDLLSLERSYYAIMLTGLPERVPSELADLGVSSELVELPVSAKIQLRAPTIPTSGVLRIFNLHQAAISAVAPMVTREQYYVRHDFQRSGDNALVYCPKPTTWAIPPRLMTSTKPIGRAFAKLGMSPGEACDAPELLVRALKTCADDEEALRALLMQLPHDWRYVGFRGGSETAGVSVGKAGLARNSKNFTGAFRVVGPAARKHAIDEGMLTGETSVGDINFLCDAIYKQQVIFKDGRFRAEVTPLSLRLRIGLPIKEAVEKNPENLRLDRYVAIDLGEYGVGWAVFSVDGNECVDKGFIRINAAVAFKKAAERGDKPREQLRRFNSKFDRAQEFARKALVGRFRHTIDLLMNHYRAFPVIESAPKSRSGAAKDIYKVFEAVTEHYTFTDNAEATGKRIGIWRGAAMWKHPTLTQVDKVSGGKKPLYLFPGVMVSDYGNSQRCSSCGRNAIETARLFGKENPNALFHTDESGVAKLANGDIQLFKRPSGKSDRDALKRRHQHGLAKLPFGKATLDTSQFIAAISETLRQPPASKHTKLSSQSQYACVYVDCGYAENADVNAAVNIAHRFKEKTAIPQTA